MTCGVNNRLVHEEPEAHASRPCCAVHLPRDKESTIPSTSDVLSRNLNIVVVGMKGFQEGISRLKDLHEESSLCTSCMVSQRITTSVSRSRPFPVQFVNCVPSVRVAPPKISRSGIGQDLKENHYCETLPALIILKCTVSWTSSSNLHYKI